MPLNNNPSTQFQNNTKYAGSLIKNPSGTEIFSKMLEDRLKRGDRLFLYSLYWIVLCINKQNLIPLALCCKNMKPSIVWEIMHLMQYKIIIVIPVCAMVWTFTVHQSESAWLQYVHLYIQNHDATAWLFCFDLQQKSCINSTLQRAQRQLFLCCLISVVLL